MKIGVTIEMKKSLQFMMTVKKQMVQWHCSFRSNKLDHYEHKINSAIRGRYSLLPPAYCRQKKRMQYEDFDKQLISLDKKRDDLQELKRNLGWEPLIPPVQKGWKRFFVLRDDVERSKHAEFFQNILKKINTYY